MNSAGDQALSPHGMWHVACGMWHKPNCVVHLTTGRAHSHTRACLWRVFSHRPAQPTVRFLRPWLVRVPQHRGGPRRLHEVHGRDQALCRRRLRGVCHCKVDEEQRAGVQCHQHDASSTMPTHVRQPRVAHLGDQAEPANARGCAVPQLHGGAVRAPARCCTLWSL